MSKYIIPHHLSGVKHYNQNIKKILTIQTLVHNQKFIFLTFAMNFVAEITGNKIRRGQIQSVVENTPGMIRINLCEVEEHKCIDRTNSEVQVKFNNNRGSVLYLPSEKFFESADCKKYFHKKKSQYYVNIKNSHKYYNPNMPSLTYKKFYALLKKHADKNAKFVVEGAIDLKNPVNKKLKKLWKGMVSITKRYAYNIKGSINNNSISLHQRFTPNFCVEKKSGNDCYLFNIDLEYVKKTNLTDLQIQNKCILTCMAIKSWLKNTVVMNFINRFYKKINSLPYHNRKGMSKIQAAKDLLIYLYKRGEFKWVLYDNNIPYDTLELVAEAMIIDMDRTLNTIVFVLFDREDIVKFINNGFEKEIVVKIGTQDIVSTKSYSKPRNEQDFFSDETIKDYLSIYQNIKNFYTYFPNPLLYELRIKNVPKNIVTKIRYLTTKIHKTKILRGYIRLCFLGNNHYIRTKDIQEKNDVKIYFSNDEDFKMFCKIRHALDKKQIKDYTLHSS